MLRRISVTQILASVGWIAATLILALLLSSVFRSTSSTVLLATGIFCALAIWRPRDAMLVAVAFIGLGDLLSVLSGNRALRAVEVIVVAILLGWCVRRLLAREGSVRSLREVNATPAALFGLVALCSTAVWMRVDQVRTQYLSTFLAELWQWLSTQYFVENARFAEVVSTAVLLESVALYVVVAAMCRDDRTFAARAVRMLIAGGAALGILSIFRLVEISVRNPNAIAMLRATGAGLRISPQIPDYIAAAAYFGLCWTTALGFALQRSRDRLFLLGAALPLMAGLFLTGSRSALGAAAGGILVLGYLVARGRNILRQRGFVRGAIIGSAVIALGVLSLLFQKFVGHDLTGVTAGASLQVRVELLKAGLSVFLTHPFFGVGLDRFFLYLDQFASPQLKTMWYGRLNPHNDFLRIAAEFGLVGLSLFLWTLIGSVRRIARTLSNGVDVRLAGLVGGLTAFGMTMFISNPLMVPATSYLFWIALGLATGEATAGRSISTSSESAAPRWGGGRVAAIAICAIVMAASVPFRAAREVGAADLAGVTYGLYAWSTSPDGVPSRLSGGRATLFIAPDARVVELSVKGTLPSDGTQTVQAYVDGRLADVIRVGRDWQRLRMVLPSAKGRARRLDLDVTPTWSPVDLDPSSGDRRAFGVRIGEVHVIRSGTAGG